MSEKLGTDFWNLSSTIYRKNNNEIFISIGPSIAIPSNGVLVGNIILIIEGKKEI